MMIGALRVSAGGGGGSLPSLRGKLIGVFGAARSVLVATFGTMDTGGAVGCDGVDVGPALVGFAFVFADVSEAGALLDSLRGAVSSWAEAGADDVEVGTFAEGEGDSARTSIRSSERGIVKGSPVA